MPRLPAFLLIVLAFASGCTDAVSYLALGQVFTANMTGNTVLLGIAAVTGDGARAGRSLCALGGFCAGVALATMITGPPRSGRLWPSGATLALAGETLALIALAAGAAAFGTGGAHVYWLIALAGIAMGAQSAAVRAVGPSAVATTYITGTLTGLIATLTWRGLARGRARAEKAPRPLWLPAAIWTIYLVAALIAAAITKDTIGAQAAWVPVAAVAAVAALAGVRRRTLAME